MDGDQIFSGVVRSVKCGQSLKGPCWFFVVAIFGTIWYYFDTKFCICEFSMRAEYPRVSRVLFGTVSYSLYY